MRFAGQGYEVVTPLPAGPYSAQSEQALRNAFEHAYETVFGRRPPVAEVEIVNIRVSLTAAAGGGELDLGLAAAGAPPQPRTMRYVRFANAESAVPTPVFERSALPMETLLEGPAIVEEASSTLLIPPRARAQVDPGGNIVVELVDY
jgi:N-methylhydantoinase A